MSVPLREAAHGRWHGILLSLGFTARTLSGRHGPCPICGEGRDRFRFDDQGRGTWICSQCGAGDGASLVMKTRGIDFKAAAALIEPLIGSTPQQEPKVAPSDEDCRRWRNEAWRGASAVQAHDAAGLWLSARVGLTTFPKTLRCHPSLVHTENGTRHPTMLAMISDRDGKPGNLHRTYLTPDGRKAAIAKVRMVMPGSYPEGGAIRLSEPAETLGIAEGIETALAASSLFDMPVWAAVNSGNLSKFKPPAIIRHLVVFADNDANFAGQHAAFQLANRLTVRDKLDVDVRVPERVGEDWNDVWASRQAAT